MATTDKSIGNVYAIQKVILSPIMDDQSGLNDNNLEPPYVRVRQRNASYTFIDNFDANSRISNNSYLIGNNGNLLSKRTKRFAISFFSAELVQPNINIRNNAIQFRVAATIYNAIIPEGFYTRTQAIAALLVAMNGAGSPATFTATNQFANSDVYIVLTGTQAFTITGGTFVTTGFTFWGFLKGDTRLSLAATNSLTLTIGPITVLYSRYFDICSTAMLQHTKASTTGIDTPANLLLRVFASKNVSGFPFDVSFVQGSETSSWNFDATHSLSTIDFQLYDEHSQPLYLPNGNSNASWIQISFTNEI